MTKKLLASAALAALSLALVIAAGPVKAQEYPSKPIRVIVPFPPGALTDTLARLVAGKLQAKLGQPALVENRAGAAGNIGTAAVYRAEPDGHTVLFTPHSPLITSKMLNPNVAFDPDAFVPIAVVTRSTVLLLASPDLKARNLEELIALAKANPGKLNYGSPGVGSTTHLTSELFNMMAGTDIIHVPYQGIAPAQTALMSGQVDLLFDAMGSTLPHVRSGKMRVIAVASDKRSPVLPDVPVIAESLPGFLSTLWTGMVAPPGTPATIARRLSSAVSEGLREPDLAKRLSELNGVEVIGSTPEAMARLMKEERVRWGKVIETTGIKAE